MSIKPYLSIVVAARNDDYGGNFLHRMQIFLNNQIHFWQKYKLNAELIIVEWNPPQDRPRLKDVLKWSDKINFGSVKIIEVPESIHLKIPGSNRIKFFEYLAKNVGVRRAVGEFILSTNSDLLYSEELIRCFAEKKLEKNAFYRIDRHDFGGNILIPLDISAAEQLELAKKNIYLIHNNFGGAFLKGENKLSWRNLRRQLTYLKNKIKFYPIEPIYMNAAGDFFLMHRDSWRELRGFPEIAPFAYPDALCFMAASLGLKQIILKYPHVIYHQDHLRFGPETGRALSDFLPRKKQYFEMLRSKKPWISNNENWGLGNIELSQHKIF